MPLPHIPPYYQDSRPPIYSSSLRCTLPTVALPLRHHGVLHLPLCFRSLVIVVETNLVRFTRQGGGDGALKQS